MTGVHDIVLHVMDYPGPTGLIVAPAEPQRDLPAAAGLLIAYSDAPGGEQVRVEWRQGDKSGILHETNPGREYLKEGLIR